MKNAYNLGVSKVLSQALDELGFNPVDIFEVEPDAGLGNGGLGRLAACYLDSMTTLEIPAAGYSICYELGIFRQRIVDGQQVELPDEWKEIGGAWLMPKPQESETVLFGGTVRRFWDNGRLHVVPEGATEVIAVPCDMEIAGYNTEHVNTLRLWDAKPHVLLNMSLFSQGEYLRAMEQEAMAEAIAKVLYPEDNHYEGKSLRLKQQYFFVSATMQSIVRKHIEVYNTVENFHEKNVIQINDTHPALVIPELMRIFMDEFNLGWDEAWKLVRASVAYTNHTVMSEALEKWPQTLVQQLLPRLWEIICEINRRWCDELIKAFGNDERVGRNLIINGDQVHMANMCLATCYRVNGVSRLHGDILKNDLFKDVYGIKPDLFTYVTNGIDHRRWLTQINPGLHELIRDTLGSEDYLTKPEQLVRFCDFADDPAVREQVNRIKLENKKRFADFALRNDSYHLNPDSVIDVQIKRLHEYKRQLLCAMSIVEMQLQLHDDPNMDFVPRTFVFGAKAAAAYKTAKRIIELLLSLSRELANDPICKDRLQVYFVENYRVSAAEAIVPAAQISEQISTAGKEASGTGCMKLMMNGAVTIGTLDGANVEMYEQLGDENMFLFGLHTDEIARWRSSGYNPGDIVRRDWGLERLLNRISAGFTDGKNYSDLVSSLVYGGDPYMLIADYRAYADCQKKLYDAIRNDGEVARMSIMNTGRSGIFAADRAVKEYVDNIWEIR
jgi:starch phosphorylase